MNISNIQKLAILIVLLVFISIIFIAIMGVNIPVNYPELIAGNISWGAATKIQDLLIVPITLTITVGVGWWLNNLFKKINAYDVGESEKIAFHLTIWGVPTLSILSSLLLYKSLELHFVYISLIGMLFILFFSRYNLKKNFLYDIEVISAGLIAVFFFSLYPLVVSMIYNKSISDINNESVNIFEVKKITIIFFIVNIVVYFYGLLFKYELLFKNISKYITASQIALTFLFVTLYPAKLMTKEGLVESYNPNIFLVVFIVFLVLLSSGDVLLRYFRYGRADFNPKIFSPFAITALIIAIKFGNTLTPSISPDDYHFGENLIGSWAYFNGYIPYVDFIPSHGLVFNDFSGVVNFIFYDGTASSLREAQRLAYAILLIVVIVSIYIYTKSLLLSSLSVMYFSGRIFWLFLIPFFTVWFDGRLLKQKVKWTIIWLITAPIAILGLPPQAILFVISSAVIPFFFLFEIIKNRDWITLKYISLIILIIFPLFFVTTVGDMLFYAIKYVVQNGSINQIAYGIPWYNSFNADGILFELIRMSWITVPFVMFFILCYAYEYKSIEVEKLLSVSAVLIFSLLLIPYTMGRIDVGSLSRPGTASVFLISGFMPLVLWSLLNENKRLWLIVCVVFVLSLINMNSMSFARLFQLTNSFIYVGELKKSKDGLLDNIGHAQVQDEHWKRLNSLAKLLDEKLKPNESYLDLTSRNAQYFYLDRLPVIPITAPYNMPSYKQQIDTIEKLKEDLPRVALLEGSNIIHDGGGLALRNYYLYRFIIENYEPFMIDNFIIGLSKESLMNNDWKGMDIPNDKRRKELFVKSFSRTNLDIKKLPISWGRSINTLSNQMELVISDLYTKNYSLNHLSVQGSGYYKVTGKKPYITFDLSDYELSGKSAGILVFEFECISPKKEVKFQITWSDDMDSKNSEQNKLFFTADDGFLIIPLDSSPRWYLLEKIKNLNIELITPQECESFFIKNISLRKRY
ncbi:hypothetical protein [Thorsellia anophelis]|uniref:Uncharacterized protein n=1 Tax=Thorsellia anophelis DSM 18579 TaxID=1123402 RepID=A0A1I0FDZ4_9GAMM|nr:hypothetical protein [Thorsellia anophelis]SET56497.1 hypothetical protein SAMN02583745_02736 [Thorsellia anophelis DSM 18579]